MSKKTIKLHGGAERFERPSHAEMLVIVVTCQLFFALMAFGVPETLEFGAEARGLLGACVLTVVLYAMMFFQRVAIDGTFVQVKNIVTCFRWRRFDTSEVREVKFIRATGDANGLQLLVTLERAPHRKWHRVQLGSDAVFTNHCDIDVPLFLAFMRAVALCQPDLKVQNLPPSYRGVLASPPIVVKPEAPPGRGKTRKRKQAAAADSADKKRRAKENVRP